jgi:hypothetical protein
VHGTCTAVCGRHTTGGTTTGSGTGFTRTVICTSQYPSAGSTTGGTYRHSGGHTSTPVSSACTCTNVAGQDGGVVWEAATRELGGACTGGDRMDCAARTATRVRTT